MTSSGSDYKQNFV